MRTTALTLALFFALAGAPRTQSPEHPPTLSLDGAAPLPLTASADRADMLGLVDLYTVAIYAGRSVSDRASLLADAAPKALRIVVTYKEDFRRGVTLDWQRELVPRFQRLATDHLRNTFMGLRHGDVVQVEYLPQKGSTIRVNRSVMVTGASHDVILTFLDHWIGQRPVSEEMKRSLLTGIGSD